MPPSTLPQPAPASRPASIATRLLACPVSAVLVSAALLSALLALPIPAISQTPTRQTLTRPPAPANPSSPQPSMKQHYDAAFRLQDQGNLPQADLEHKAFLAIALHRIANARANIGNYAQAAPLYDQALQLTPSDPTLNLDYAGAALDARDPAKARLLSQAALDLEGHAASNTAATAILAQALWGLGQHQEAIQQLKLTAQRQPTSENLYALADAYLILGDRAHGAQVFSQMLARFKDSAALHMRFGRAYAQTSFYAEAVDEFKKALSKDNQLPGLHYSLGAATMQLEEEKGYPQAEAEFHKELALHPNDTFTYPQLGSIAIKQHRTADAEKYLKHAIALDPGNTRTYLLLGELYRDQERLPEEEAALRKAIEVTLDPAANNYEIERGYFWLGRLLVQNGNRTEGQKYLKTARDLLDEQQKREETAPDGKILLPLPLERTHTAKPSDAAEEKLFETNISPLLATSYNNLGVHAAMRSDYPAAAQFFQQAITWDPNLTSAQNNLVRATNALTHPSQN